MTKVPGRSWLMMAGAGVNGLRGVSRMPMGQVETRRHSWPYARCRQWSNFFQSERRKSWCCFDEVEGSKTSVYSLPLLSSVTVTFFSFPSVYISPRDTNCLPRQQKRDNTLTNGTSVLFVIGLLKGNTVWRHLVRADKYCKTAAVVDRSKLGRPILFADTGVQGDLVMTRARVHIYNC